MIVECMIWVLDHVNKKESKYMNKVFFIVVSGVVITLLFVLIFIHHVDDVGVQQIRAVRDISGKISLNIDYIDCYGYSVSILEEGEDMYLGENLLGDDGSLGKYRIKIGLSDTKASKKLYKQYPAGTVHELAGVPAEKAKFKMRMIRPDDGGLIIYIGSDEPIDAAKQDFTKINFPIGTIKIPLEK